MLDPAVGRNNGDEGNERMPEPFVAIVLSKTDKNAFEPEELCRACPAPVRFDSGGFSNSTALPIRLSFTWGQGLSTVPFPLGFFSAILNALYGSRIQTSPDMNFMRHSPGYFESL